ncbi:MAG: hypothetical protein HYS45_02875 [Parcubacteria group bacterium]|nr:hypothetical protein [Parcubacteria group bacterium]
MLTQNNKRNLLEYSLIAANALVLGLIWFVAVWRFSVSEDFIPLHYTIYFGLDRFGPKYDLFLFPTLGSVILGVNLLVSRVAFWGNYLWQGLFLGFTLLEEVVLLVSLILALLKGLS